VVCGSSARSVTGVGSPRQGQRRGANSAPLRFPPTAGLLGARSQVPSDVAHRDAVSHQIRGARLLDKAAGFKKGSKKAHRWFIGKFNEREASSSLLERLDRGRQERPADTPPTGERRDRDGPHPARA
jgi:hypothetical protein